MGYVERKVKAKKYLAIKNLSVKPFLLHEAKTLVPQGFSKGARRTTFVGT
jgi:hypothetical protein